MDTYIARQPIFDRAREVYGYELLFRSGPANFFDFPDVDRAARQMIRESAVLFGIETLTRGRQAFINMTRESLVKDYASLLPPDLAVLEILESVDADAEVLAACRTLKKRGYRLALDDFVYRDSLSPLVDIVDLIKVDFLVSNSRERRQLFARLAPKGKILLAEKLETAGDFREAYDIGYHLFQGYFFSKPLVLTRHGTSGMRRNLLRFLKEIHEPNLNYRELGDRIKQDLSLSYQLLCHLKGAREIRSIEQALDLMDESEIKRWAGLAALAALIEDKPVQRTIEAAMRAKMCEMLALRTGREAQAPDFFLLGLFSLVAGLESDLETSLSKLPLPADVKSALLRRGDNDFRSAYETVLACERADHTAVNHWSRALELEPATIFQCHVESRAWAEEIHG